MTGRKKYDNEFDTKWRHWPKWHCHLSNRCIRQRDAFKFLVANKFFVSRNFLMSHQTHNDDFEIWTSENDDNMEFTSFNFYKLESREFDATFCSSKV